jgi:hypothetical protein
MRIKVSGRAGLVLPAWSSPYSPALAVILFTAGGAFAFGFAVWRTGGLWRSC